MKNKKILILGANGMLGHDLADVFKDQDPILFDIKDLDIADEEAVESKLSEIRPDVVINAAAYTNVDGAQDNKEMAFEINAKAAGHLARTCHKIDAVLVHYSTEYVFDGQQLRWNKSE